MRISPTIVATFAFTAGSCAPVQTPDPEVQAWEARAEQVTIIRDDWGIPHIYAETDADAVFGMMYAQAEDDFNRIEVNYLNSTGRLAEAEGADEVFRDLRMKLFIDPDDMRARYEASPEWLKDLMDAFADGLNYYLHTHPDVEPRVIQRFEPWMALTFSEGSIGGDIEQIELEDLEAFYGPPEGPLERAAASASPSPGLASSASPSASVATAGVTASSPRPLEPTGSNGFAIAGSNTESGNALLLINPHTSFYFRAEVHVTSQEGLNAYGAVTWGQFFVYQGFNETAGWMHTSTGADAIDEFRYDVDVREDGVFYPYGDEMRRMEERTVSVPYLDGGTMAEREFTVYASHHGPIIRGENGRWISVKLMVEPETALIQSYTRTKAAGYEEFREVMDLHSNSSNNTVFADAQGNIAYFHSNYIPIRDPRFDWQHPVDGSVPATEWQGLHTVDESPLVLNPPNGWIQNTNNWPYSAAGPHSPREDAFPPYMDTSGENARGRHAIRVLEGRTDFTLQRLIDAAYDSYLVAFEDLIPALMASYDATPEADPLKSEVSEQIETLRSWDYRYALESIATSVAVFWGDEMWRRVEEDEDEPWSTTHEAMMSASARAHLEALAAATDTLEARFGEWRTPWGEINRFQRLTGDIVQPFDDDEPSIPVAFTTSRWGSLAVLGQRTFNNTARIYGTRGNSFVAVVEFGDRLRARAITAGGQSGDPASPHFNDQAERYSTGDLRTVYFYREDVEAHAERSYRPGG
jgi:acyl-homoserine-lactone acylase